ncbi:hypothetical protein [Pseudonocardia sp. WMMC193]|uniref:hypothetical protein n=1 Tax=Pseudonocardia sp. WMMC193 TaxID=2911965 RepID=UPI001F2F7EA2|nr:hypothetical protein [Pseudonocardia sp. WMMC193]MCF7550882.1 hypothetical protein [Pseudonocardia sp. WMMC193]
MNDSRKCSAPWTAIPRRTSNAVAMALVPVVASVNTAPGTAPTAASAGRSAGTP